MRRGSNPVLLSLGGNLGDVALTFDRAAAELERNGFHIWKRSGVYRSAAMGCEEGAPDFLNCSILGEWNDTLFSLLERIHRIEEMFGRPSDHPHWVSRTLDIDIIAAGDTMLNTPTLTIPHPELPNRDFVLIPSAEIAPDMNIPGICMSFSELLLKRGEAGCTLTKRKKPGKGVNMDYLQEKIQALLDSFVEKGTECGCQAALYINGELAVNAYAGWTDWTKTRKIDADTVFPIYSTGKAIASTVIHRLVEKGILDYDMYVGDVWPEYACKGKEKTKLWHMLAYRMGMMKEPEYRTDEERADWNLMCSRLAAMEPAYPPGTKQQYHPATYGWLIGEVACRATGKDFATLCREEVCRPAGMDRFFYGIAEDEENTATLVKALDGRCYSEEVIERMNKPVFRRCCNPSTCTMSNALSIARHYAALDTCTLLTRETIDNATILRRAEDDMIPIEPGRWELFGLGYVLSGPKDDLGRIFGHGGVGGSEGLLDRKQHFAIGYTRNLFADPNGRNEFLKLIGLKNRDW